LIRDTEVTVDEWERQKSIMRNPRDNSTLKLGFATFFLNRTNRSGILDGGIIGGKNQDGPWKLDARFNRDNLIGRIESIALFGSRIRIYNLDAKELIRDVIPNL